MKMLFLKELKLKGITYWKELLIIIMSSSMEKLLWSTNIERYEEIRKLTAGQGEYYTTGCLLDYIKIISKINID